MHARGVVAAAATVLLLLASSASADDLSWVGCNTNFKNQMNWASSGVLPWTTADQPTPATTVYFAPESGEKFLPVNSLVHSGTYKFHEIVMAPNTMLTLSSDGTELVFFDRASTTGKAKFIASTPERMKDPSCNFKCHKAWRKNYVSPAQTGTPVALPPCDEDVAKFPATSTYRVLAQGIINVKGLEFEDQAITSKYDIPEFQITPAGDSLKLFINNKQNCHSSGLVKNGVNCFCHSQCVGEDVGHAQNSELRAQAKFVANEDVSTARTTTTRQFSLQYVLNNFLPAEAVAEFGCLNSASKISALQQHLMTKLAEDFPGSTISSLSIAVGSTITVAGVAVFTHDNVNLARSDGSRELWWNRDEIYRATPAPPNLLGVNVWRHLLYAARHCAGNTVQDQIDAVLESCRAAGVLPCDAIATIVAGHTTPSAAFSSVLSQLQAYLAGSMTSPFVGDLSAFMADKVAQITAAVADVQEALQAGVSATDMTQLAAQLAPLQAQKNDAVALATARLPSFGWSRDKHTITMIAGRNLPQGDLNHMVTSRNADLLRAHIAANLPGTPPVLSVTAASIVFQVKSDQFEDAGRRRREADPTTAGQAHSPLYVTYEYEMLQRTDCASEDMSAFCPMQPGSGSYLLVENMLDDIVTTFVVATPSCYSLDTGNNIACGAEVARGIIRANPRMPAADLEDRIRDALVLVFSCYSAMCSEHPDAQAELEAAIVEASNMARQSTNASSNAQGSFPLAAVAGAAAGLLLIVIIIIVVMRRRNRNTAEGGRSGKSAGDRTVVAFENPMYDEPERVMYDEAPPGAIGEDEGLYDEPAFNEAARVAKENPMYQSVEDLTRQDVGEEGGGYLDVAPDESEYDQ